MAEVNWAEPVVQELGAVAEYIALDNPVAAGKLVEGVVNKIERLADSPESWRIPNELSDSDYREVVVPPCRIYTAKTAN